MDGRRRWAVTLGALALGTAPIAALAVPAGAESPDPAVNSTSGGRLGFFRTLDDGTLSQQQLDPAGYTAPVNLGGALTSGPASVTVGPEFDVTYAFAAGTDHALWYRAFSGGRGTWGGWTRFGGTTYDDPAASCTGTAPAEQTVVYLRGTDDRLWARNLAGGSWVAQGGRLSTGVAAVSAVNGVCPAVQDVFGVGTNFQVYENRGNAGWQLLGGRSLVRPAVLRLPDGQTDVYVTGTDGALWMSNRPSDTGRWSMWQRVGGYLTSAPAAQVIGSDRVVVARGGNGVHYRATLVHGSSTWLWTQIPG